MKPILHVADESLLRASECVPTDRRFKPREHTPLPDGYVARATYAMRLLREGHVQEQCPACGLWAIFRRVRP